MQEQHLSLEMAARQLRYRWWKELFDNTAHENHPTSIALGHHQDDSIETLLMNLMRGTGIQGLTGIVVFNEQTHVIRPLLCLSRHDIMDYLRDNDLSYVIDSTNSDNDTLRNQIRNQLLPLMEQLVPQTRQGISQTMEHLSATAYFADRYLGQYDHLTRHFSQWGMEWDELSLEAAAEQFPEHLEDFLHAWQTRHTATNCTQVVHTPNLLYTAPIDEAAFEAYRPTLSIETTELTNKGEEVPRPSSPYENSFDADTVTLPLTLRRWQEGDRISPLGMKGRTKLVSDLFSNAHYTPMQKATTWLVCDATSTILWVIGLRMSDKHKITPATTRILKVTCR
jgi:tRNA(Ile)-lysidine synthase